jgi:N-acetylglutamate synthase-like GNAT family acetyltransferase
MRETKDSVRPATKADIAEFAQRARDAETKEQILTAFAEVILRNARQHWVDEFWDIIRR